MANIFNTIKVKTPPRSQFDLSHDVKLSCKMGQLVPVLCQEALPGDVWQMQNEAMLRLMPMIAPIMHKCYVYTHYWFVPNRILWDGWEDFITGGEDGQSAPDLPFLQFPAVNLQHTVADYFGLPLTTYEEKINALPFAAYQCIYSEWYRDQNLQVNEKFEKLGNGQAANSLNIIRNRAWQHDYFTACLPWAQKGAPVEIPMDFSDVKIVPSGDLGHPHYTSTDIPPPGHNYQFTLTQTNPGLSPYEDFIGLYDQNNPHVYHVDGFDPDGTLALEGGTVTSINDLRSAYSLQRWLEKNARGGTRYKESLVSHFNVSPGDARLQRPEYIGGSKSSLSISEVLQTSSTDDVSPQGNMAGHGVSILQGNRKGYMCKEHGWILCLLSIRPQSAYYQGIPRMFSRRDRLDYYWPDFAFLGEQSVLRKELFCDGTDGKDDDVFGYIPRYSEYRYIPSRVCGEMRTTLDFWHMGRNLVAPNAVLNADFIKCVPTKRIFAVEDENEDEIIAHVFHRILARRPLPRYGTPGIF